MSEERHEYEDYVHMLKPALTSKEEEFIVLGYEDVTKEDIWKFLTEKVWKQPKEGIRMYELVADVMSVQVGDYMNFATVESYKSDPFKDLDSDELKELLQTEDT